ncbi:MAG: RidA family protein [Candidatus Thorarchaeota archaeon]|nr:MAG: RidA family protein [Candidatus Thorarchaeota archaeon]
MKLIDIDSEAKKNNKAHYSAAVVHNGIVYVSGQLPIDPKTGIPVKGGIKEQTRAVFRKLTEVLAKAGSSKERILRTTAYIPDVSLWNEVNEVYAEYFGNYKPARTVVPTTKLHFGCLIEIDAIAFIDE